MMRCEIMHPQCRRPNLVQLHVARAVIGQGAILASPCTTHMQRWLLAAAVVASTTAVRRSAVTRRLSTGKGGVAVSRAVGKSSGRRRQE